MKKLFLKWNSLADMCLVLLEKWKIMSLKARKKRKMQNPIRNLVWVCGHMSGD